MTIFFAFLDLKIHRPGSISRTSSTEESSNFNEDYAEIVDEEADYSSPSRDFEINRECVNLSEILGQGQFGDVYGGLYSHPSGTDIPVAVKTCKLEAGEGTAEKILEEARKSIYINPVDNLEQLCNETAFSCFGRNENFGSSSFVFNIQMISTETLSNFGYGRITFKTRISTEISLHR